MDKIIVDVTTGAQAAAIVNELVDNIVIASEPSPNLFDITNQEEGYLLNADGTTLANATYNTVQQFDVEAGTDYGFMVNPESVYRSGVWMVVWFDASDVAISYEWNYRNNTDLLFATSPANAVSARISYKVDELSDCILAKASDFLTLTEGELFYAPFGLQISKDKLQAKTPPNRINGELIFGDKLLSVFDPTPYEIILPIRLYANENKPTKIFFDNIINNGNLGSVPTVYTSDLYSTPEFVEIDNAAGTSLSTRFFINMRGVAENPGTLDEYYSSNKAMTVITSASDAGNGVTAKILVIGDSLAASGKTTQKLLDIFGTDVMSIELLGSEGTAPNNHEGHAGWRAYTYTQCSNGNEDGSLPDVSNPFWNPVSEEFDFSYYMTQQGYTDVDVVVIDLGRNDMARDSFETDAELYSYFNAMITSIKAYDSNIKIMLCLCGMPSSLTCAPTVRKKRHRLHKMLIQYWGGQFGSDIYVVPSGAVLDGKNDYGFTDELVNPYGTETYRKCTDPVHPADSGYYIKADMWYGYIKSII